MRLASRSGLAAARRISCGQLGGQSFHELIIFDNKADLDRFKEGKLAFAANASAVLISAGAAAASGRKGTHVFLHSEGGMMLEAAIGRIRRARPGNPTRLRLGQPGGICPGLPGN